MENKDKGQEVNADFKGNRGKYPDSKEVLEKDLVDPQDYDSEESHTGVVKSSDPESQEWQAREDEKKH